MNMIRRQELGFHKNNKRLWINKGTIADAHLSANDPIKYHYDFDKHELVITKVDISKHKVANTFKGAVLDITNRDLSTLFQDYEHVDVIPSHECIIVRGSHAESEIIEREQSVLRRLKTGEPLRKGGAFAGLGLLCRSVHRGLKKASVAVKQRFANEYNPLAAEVNRAGNEIWDDAFDDAVFVVDDIYTMNMDLVPKLDLLVVGSPCPAFSQLNTQHKVANKKDIFHPESGTIFQPLLSLIRKANPAVLILENSKFFADSIFDYIMCDVLNRFGYKSHSTIVTGEQFGDFERRERLCKVWYSKGLPDIDLSDLPFQQANERPFSSILEPISDDDKRWGRRSYLEAKHAETHNGHKYCIVSPDATVIPTCGANYHKVQPDSAMIAHPDPARAMETRIMTASEHCNMRDIDGELKANIVAVEEGSHFAQQTGRSNAKEAHRMLGNSCSPLPWVSVGYRIGQWLLSMVKPSVQACVESIAPSAPITPINKENQLGFGF